MNRNRNPNPNLGPNPGEMSMYDPMAASMNMNMQQMYGGMGMNPNMPVPNMPMQGYPGMAGGMPGQMMPGQMMPGQMMGGMPGMMMPGMGMPGMPGMAGMGGGAAGGHKGESIWQLIDDRMRGRWRWAIVLGVLLAGALGVLGYLSAVPYYQSTAVVKITPNVPLVMGGASTELEPIRQNYSRFVATQVQMMKQGRVLEQALKDSELAKSHIVTMPNATKYLKDRLDVEPDRDSELVYLTCRSEDANEAFISANAVVNAYYKVCVEQENSVTKTLNDISQLVRTSESSINEVQTRRNELTNKYQTPDLNALSKRNTDFTSDLAQRITLGERLLARMKASEPDGSRPVAPVPPTSKQLEDFEPSLIVLKQLVTDADIRFQQIKGMYTPRTMTYIDAERKLADAKQLFEKKMQEAIDAYERSGGDPAVAKGGQFEGKTPEQIQQEIDGYRAELEETRKSQRELLKDLQDFEQLTKEEERTRTDLNSLQDRKRSLEREKNALAGVITIANEASRPTMPTEDARSKRAVMGAALGLLGSFSLFFLIGTIDRRAYGASQLHAKEGSAIPSCLGVLPDLGASINDPESSDVASHCVHQIRNQIEAVRTPRDGYALAITSPFQGDGKTSIVMALGWSYAAAGYRTLLVDCDMVGRSLTRQMGLIGREGLREVMLTRTLNGSVNQMPVDNLSVIPVGVDLRFGPENVRRVDLERVLEQLRGQYDIIIMDTGPLLGALESTPVTAVADGVVLSVRRGRSRAKLEECVNRLNLVGTSCVGVILNCAVRSDCNRYVSEASLAAAEEDRGNRPAGENREAPVPGERNALIRAMRQTSRGRNES